MNLGMELTTLLPQLVDGNIVVLSDVLYTATITGKSRLSKDEVNESVETTDDIEVLSDETLKYLEESNAGKLIVKNFKKALMEDKQERN